MVLRRNNAGNEGFVPARGLAKRRLQRVKMIMADPGLRTAVIHHFHEPAFYISLYLSHRMMHLNVHIL